MNKKQIAENLFKQFLKMPYGDSREKIAKMIKKLGFYMVWTPTDKDEDAMIMNYNEMKNYYEEIIKKGESISSFVDTMEIYHKIYIEYNSKN